MRKDWSDVGWQGVSLLAPPDWNLVGMSGDRSRGYLRADGPSGCAVEARWVPSPTQPDLESRAERYLGELKRTSKKRRVRFSSKIKQRKPTPTEMRSGGGSVGFTWQADRAGYGRILWCGECKRLVIGQVVGPPDKDLSGEATEILNSICSHDEPGWSVWGMYGFKAAIPESYRLLRHTLMSSYLQLVFKRREGELTVERWGLAGMLTRDKGLDGWYNYEYRPENSGFALSLEKGEIEGHETLEISGKRKLLAKVVRLPKTMTGRGQPNILSARIWLCPESNRIYGVRLLHYGNRAVLNEVVGRMKCH